MNARAKKIYRILIMIILGALILSMLAPFLVTSGIQN